MSLWSAMHYDVPCCTHTSSFCNKIRHNIYKSQSGMHGCICLYVVDRTGTHILFYQLLILNWFSSSAKSVRGSAELCCVVSFLQLHTKIHTRLQVKFLSWKRQKKKRSGKRKKMMQGSTCMDLKNRCWDPGWGWSSLIFVLIYSVF